MTQTTGRPLKVGIQLPEVEREVRWPELLDMTRAIEDLGFDSVWVGEHLLYRWPDRPPRGPWEAWTLLSAIAASTSRIELGPLVACTNFHNPALLAKQAVDDRRDQRRPVRARPGRRLERDRVPRLRLPVRPPGRPVRGGVHDHPDAAARRRHRLRRPLVPGPRLRAAAARPASGRSAADDRLDRAADAPGDDAPRRFVERLVQRHRERPRRASPRLRGLVDEACRDVGRDPAAVERTVAALVRLPGGGGRLQGSSRRPRSRRSTAIRSALADALRGFAREGIAHVQLVLDPITLDAIRAVAPVLAELDRA